MARTPKVSIIIPVKPGRSVTAVERLTAVEYPSDAFEVLVAEGCSPSLQRNRAAAVATGDILYFLDDDSLAASGFLARTARHYEDPQIAAVGGPSVTPDSDSSLQHAFGMAFTSVLGGGGMRNRYRRTGSVRVTCDSELILCNLSFRRDAFLHNGGFDERLYPNEENELMDRIRHGGGLLVHDPDLAVTRSQRANIGAFCRQLFGYGRGRGEQTVISGVVKPITFIPTLFLFYLLLLPLVNKPVYYLPLLCYLIATVCVALYHGATSGRLLAAAFLPVVIPLFHVCYGLGMIKGLASSRHRRLRSSGEVNVRKVKEFGRGWETA